MDGQTNGSRGRTHGRKERSREGRRNELKDAWIDERTEAGRTNERIAVGKDGVGEWNEG